MAQEIPEMQLPDLPAEFPEGTEVLDVREHDEWEAGHIEQATHIPMSDVPARLGEVPDDKQVIVVCRAGGRSARVTGYLVGQGRDAVNLAGGMLGWQSAGRAMSSETGAAPDVV
ncbi:MAG: rhodanese-like domain-containing protein [Nocardioidaceae bacterium]